MRRKPKIIKNDAGNPVGVLIKPKEYTHKQLLTFTEGNIFNVDHTKPRTCRIIVHNQKHIVLNPEYLNEVSKLDPTQRERHIASTFNNIVESQLVAVFHGGSKEKE